MFWPLEREGSFDPGFQHAADPCLCVQSSLPGSTKGSKQCLALLCNEPSPSAQLSFSAAWECRLTLMRAGMATHRHLLLITPHPGPGCDFCAWNSCPASWFCLGATELAINFLLSPKREALMYYKYVLNLLRRADRSH